jgi:diguanylate cyclase (GGDEF)-like protein
VPGGLLLLGVAGALRAAALRDSVTALAPAAPWVVFGAGVLLGWRFRRSQLVLALLVLFAADRALAGLAPAGGAGGGTARVVFTALALLVPLDLAALAWLTERATGLWVWGALAAEPLAIVLLCRPELAPVAAALERGVLGAPRAAWTPLSEPALGAFALAFVLTVARFLLRQTIIHSSFAWAVGAAFLAFAAGGGGPAASLYLAAGGLVLVVSLVETSHRMAYVDELTGLPGRRALDEALGRLGGQYAIAMVDIDHFKRFNDEHGHDAGDQLLRKIGTVLAEVQGGGRAHRYGGEEFAVLFPGRTVDEALPHLEAFRKTLERASFTLRGRDRPERKPKQPLPAPGRRRIAVTVSIGVAGPRGDAATPEEVIQAADEALYRAKHAGRNRIYKAG